MSMNDNLLMLWNCTDHDVQLLTIRVSLKSLEIVQPVSRATSSTVFYNNFVSIFNSLWDITAQAYLCDIATFQHSSSI